MSALVQEWHQSQAAEVWARMYLRVSRDRSGRQRSNAEQLAENTAAAEERGWQLGEPYSDIGSASKYARKARKGFDQLVADIRAGSFGAQVLIVWEPSRGSRKVWEWAQLLELCEERGIRLYVTEGDTLVDPASHRQWRAFMDEVLDAEYEARKTSGRVKRSTKADARSGKLPAGGRRMYGYARGGKVQEPAEAAEVQDAVARVLKGDTVRSIARDWNDRGLLTTAGNPWHPGPLANLLRNPRLSGRREVNGQLVPIPGCDPIVDEVTHKRAVAVLEDRSPVGRRGRTSWLLTGLLKCGRCGANLMAQTDTRGVRRYVCRQGPGQKGCGGLTIKAEPTEELLVDAALAHLEAAQLAQSAPGPDEDPELAELERIEAGRDDLAEQLADPDHPLTAKGYARASAAFDRREEAAQRALAAKVRKVHPLELIADAGAVGSSWEELAPDRQRQLLEVLYDRVVVGPTQRRGTQAFEPERLQLIWQEDALTA